MSEKNTKLFKFTFSKRRRKKEVKEKPQLGGPWKVPMFGGPWKEKEKHSFHLFSFPPPTNFT